MKKNLCIVLILINSLLFIACGAYSFTGGSTGDAKTLQIDFFPNQASLIEPQLSQRFTQEMQDLFLRQTNLDLTNTGGDLRFEGEITGYRINPMSATSQQTAAQNRLTITVNVRFYNRLKEEDDFHPILKSRIFSQYLLMGDSEIIFKLNNYYQKNLVNGFIPIEYLFEINFTSILTRNFEVMKWIIEKIKQDEDDADAEED